MLCVQLFQLKVPQEQNPSETVTFQKMVLDSCLQELQRIQTGDVGVSLEIPKKKLKIESSAVCV